MVRKGMRGAWHLVGSGFSIFREQLWPTRLPHLDRHHLALFQVAGSQAHALRMSSGCFTSQPGSLNHGQAAVYGY